MKEVENNCNLLLAYAFLFIAAVSLMWTPMSTSCRGTMVSIAVACPVSCWQANVAAEGRQRSSARRHR